MPTIYIAPGTVSSWTVPEDCIKIDSVDCFGAAGSGAVGAYVTMSMTGGGGGAFSRKNNIPVFPGSVIPLNVGLGGAGVSAVTGQAYNGNAGGDTWFGPGGSYCYAQGGRGGNALAYPNAVPGGPGGQASAGIGDLKYSGGRGGNANGTTTGTSGQVTAGGGCAGPNGNGVDGGDVSTKDTASLGGAGDAYAGGAGSQGHIPGFSQNAASGVGGTGTELGSGYGCGGGSGNARCAAGPAVSAVTGTGGQFGGGSGAAFGQSSGNSAQSGQAHHGFIVIRYTPVKKVPPFNIPMMGL